MVVGAPGHRQLARRDPVHGDGHDGVSTVDLSVARRQQCDSDAVLNRLERLFRTSDLAGNDRRCAVSCVSRTRRFSRTNNVTRRSRSSSRICLLNAGWEMNSRSAARVKCSSSATATK